MLTIHYCSSIFRSVSHLYRQTCFTLSTNSVMKLDWTMKKFIDSKQYHKVLDLFEKQSTFRTQISINLAIKACTELQDYQRGIDIIKHLPANSFNNHFIQTSLIRFYMQCHDIDNANRIFAMVVNKSNFTYTAMLKGYLLNKMADKALDLFDTITIQPNAHTLSVLFKACGQANNERAKKMGLELLHQIPNEIENLTVLMNSALSMLMDFNEVERAEKLFGSMKEKDVVSYSVMMQSNDLSYRTLLEHIHLEYFDNDVTHKVLDLFEEMSVDPDNGIYMIIFKACARLADERAVNIGKKVLNHIRNEVTTNNVLSTLAMHMLMQFGDTQNAEHIFKSIKNKNVISYSAMMQGYLENDMIDKALDLFEEMSVDPDNVIYMMIFKACARLANERAMNIGKKLLNQIANKIPTDNVLSNLAMHMLMRFGDIQDAESLFKLTKNKDAISYGTMMQGYLENDMPDKTLDLFEQISVNPNNAIYVITFKACVQLANERARNIGKKLLHQILNIPVPDHTVLSAAIHMLIRFDDVKGAENLFQSIKNKDISTYASMMKVYNLNRQPLKTLQLFQIIKQQGLVPDATVFTLSINACSQLGIQSVCLSLVAQIPSHLHTKPTIFNNLIDMWGKAGSVEKAEKIFKSIDVPTIGTYNSMINGFGLNGRGLEAVHLFEKIPYQMRDNISYVYVLNACSHGGLLNQARTIFKQITIKTSRIVTTMIDCLSRLSLFDEAEQLLAQYEKSNPPCLPMYMAIMSSARNYRDSVRCEKLYKRINMLFPHDKNDLISASILLSNIYSSLGDDDQAGIIRSNRLKIHGKKATPGITWTEKDGEIVEFQAHDHSHPLAKKIYDELKLITDELIQHGHQFDPTWITRPLNDDETIESVLCAHSEKIAIAFHFIDGRRPSFIQISKNLRICGDCHQATKLIAKIRQCDIMIRDANRIHYFSRNGTCSCDDHF